MKELYWTYGQVECVGYPLDQIDSISPSGDINYKSVLSLVVFNESADHLLLMEGVMEGLLKEKWNTFGKKKFTKRFVMFFFYIILFYITFNLRQGTLPTHAKEYTNISMIPSDVEILYVNACYQLEVNNKKQTYRVIGEIMVVAFSLLYIAGSIRDLSWLGNKDYLFALKVTPTKVILLFSHSIILIMVPVTGACFYRLSDIMAVTALLTTATYFFFFTRAFKPVGMFVVMIYQMVKMNLLRLFSIYAIFIVGYSQSMFVLFRGYKNPYFNGPIESMISMFRISVGEFSEIYKKFTNNVTDCFLESHPKHAMGQIIVVRIVFMIYMVLVTLLILNLLIVIMGHTYEKVVNSQKEWLRQWAKIILVLELSMHSEERKRNLLKYSQAMTDSRRALVLRWRQNEKSPC